MERLAFTVNLDVPNDQAVSLVTDALKSEGFGVLTRIDVKETLKEKLGEEFRPYVIIGACNPPLAHRALSIESAVGTMLPCNVTVEDDDNGGSIVRLLNPKMMLSSVGLQKNPELDLVAQESFEKIQRVTLSLNN